MESIKVSIITPIYNVEDYLERCVNSLLSQSFEEIEFIFIDDKSVDSSLDTLKNAISKFPNRLNFIHIIENSTNKGSAESRNIGLSVATGEYVLFADADDWIEKEMIKNLYDLALTKSADMIWCNFFIDFETTSIKVEQNIINNPKIFAKSLVNGSVQGMIWNKLFRKEIIDFYKIHFIKNLNMAEDRTFLFKILSKSKIITHLKSEYYHYTQTNPISLTRDINSTRIYEEIGNAQDLITFIDLNKINWISQDDLDSFKFRVKIKLLFTKDITHFKNWKNIFPEVNTLILIKQLKKRHQLLAYLANNNCWMLIKGWIVLKNISKS